MRVFDIMRVYNITNLYLVSLYLAATKKTKILTMYKFTGKCEYRKRKSSIIPQSTSNKNLRKTSIKTT